MECAWVRRVGRSTKYLTKGHIYKIGWRGWGNDLDRFELIGYDGQYQNTDLFENYELDETAVNVSFMKPPYFGGHDVRFKEIINRADVDLIISLNLRREDIAIEISKVVEKRVITRLSA